MKGHAPLGSESTPTLAAVGRGEAARAPAADAASSVQAVGAGAAMNQSAALSMQTVGAGNSFAMGLASGGDGAPAEPDGAQAIGGYAAAAPEAMEPEAEEAFREQASATLGTMGDGAPPADAGASAEVQAAATDGPQIDVANVRPVNDKWDRTTVGVGEEVTFWGSVGGGVWASTAGVGTVGPDGQYQWTAPSDFAAPTITYTVNGTTTSVVMAVMAPVAILGTLIGATNVSQTAGLAGAGMDIKLEIGPANVSFYNVEWLEDPGGPSEKTGYFTHVNDASLYHNPNPNWLLMGDDNKGITDTAAYFGAPAPFSEGSFTWIIPNRFRVGGQGVGRPFWWSVQTMTLAPDGTATVNKFGQSSSRSP